MKIKDKYEKEGPLYSFEVFPPKREGDLDNMVATLHELAQWHPDYMSVTYGAAGAARGMLTLKLAEYIRKELDIEPLMHLTCVGYSQAELAEILARIEAAGIENTLLLRGDRREDGETPSDGFRYANELVAYVRSKHAFCIGAATYPEGHTEARSLTADLIRLRDKVNAGADFLVTQLFFDNDAFFRFLETARSIDINVPISAGIMPCLNKAQIVRMTALSGASLPPKFRRMLDRYEHAPEAMYDAGIAYACEQIIDLLSSGADGIHLYVMNRPEVAQAITRGIGRTLQTVKEEHRGTNAG